MLRWAPQRGEGKPVVALQHDSHRSAAMIHQCRVDMYALGGLKGDARIEIRRRGAARPSPLPRSAFLLTSGGIRDS